MTKAQPITLDLPPFYNYPPFWTKQKNPEVLRQQIQLWSSWICYVCKTINKTQFVIDDILDQMIFNNKKIHRNLEKSFLIEILDDMVKQRRAEYVSTEKNQVRIYWRTLDEWGDILLDFASRAGKGPWTYYDLAKDDDNINEKFHGIDIYLLDAIIKRLEEQHKVQILNKDKRELEYWGVKFL